MIETLRLVLRRAGAVIGLCVLGAIIVAALIAPSLYPDGPWEIVGAPFEKPFQRDYPLGADALGRDLLTAIVWGSRMSLALAVVATVVALSIGTFIGAVAGYFGGRIDDLLMRITEFFQTIPSFVLATVLIAILAPSLWTIILAIAVVSWPQVARLVRGQFLSLRHREFVEAAIALGVSTPRIIFVEILPNAITPVIVFSSLMIANAVLLEAAISFLGLGDQNVMSWGYMVGQGRTVIRDAWWVSFFPGLAIVATVLSLNLVADALNDALNPHLARRGRA